MRPDKSRTRLLVVRVVFLVFRLGIASIAVRIVIRDVDARGTPLWTCAATKKENKLFIRGETVRYSILARADAGVCHRRGWNSDEFSRGEARKKPERSPFRKFWEIDVSRDSAHGGSRFWFFARDCIFTRYFGVSIVNEFTREKFEERGICVPANTNTGSGSPGGDRVVLGPPCRERSRGILSERNTKVCLLSIARIRNVGNNPTYSEACRKHFVAV